MKKAFKHIIVDALRVYDSWGHCPLPRACPNDLEALEELPLKGRMRNKFDMLPSDRLSPLWKFLESNVGRKWDDVYSEICRVNDRRSLLGNHLLDHVKGLVDIVSFERNGYKYGNRGQLNRGYYYGRYYVDVDGILRSYPKYSFKRQWRQRRLDKALVKYQGQYYFRQNETWYKATTAKQSEIPAVFFRGELVRTKLAYCVFLDKQVSYSGYMTNGFWFPEGLYVKSASKVERSLYSVLEKQALCDFGYKVR